MTVVHSIKVYYTVKCKAATARGLGVMQDRVSDVTLLTSINVLNKMATPILMY